MINADHLTWADEIADALLYLAGADLERPPSVRALSIMLLGTKPQSKAIANEGEIWPAKERWQITIRAGLPPEREPVVLGHELSHWWFLSRGEEEPTVGEEFHDAVGARLAAPAIPFRHAMAAYGHRVHALAKAFHTTQKVSLLRIAELEGRPSLVNRPKGRIVRGAQFDWPEDLRTVPRSKAHLIKVDDCWGMIAAA